MAIKNEDFLVLSPQQYITVYGMLFDKLVSGLGGQYAAFNILEDINEQKEQIVINSLSVAKKDNTQDIEHLFRKGLFSRREYNAAITANNAIEYSKMFLFDSTFKLGLWVMAQKGYFSFCEYSNNKQAVECSISIKNYIKDFSVFRHQAVYGEELLNPTFTIERVANAESDEIANINRAIDVIRSRASYFYTEWLRGQIKYDARMREIESQDYTAKIIGE